MSTVVGLDRAGGVLVDTGPQDVVVNEQPRLRQRALQFWTADGARRSVADAAIRRRGGATQIVAADACDGGPVWVETRSTEMIATDWRVWSRPRGSSRPVLLGSSPEVAPGPGAPATPPGTFTIRRTPTTVYWSASQRGTTPRNGGWRAVVVAAPVAGGRRVQVVATDAKLPATVGEDLLYVSDNSLDARIPRGRYEVRRKHAGRERVALTGRLLPGEEVTALAASPDVLVTVVSHRGASDHKSARMTVRRRGQPDLTITLHGDGTDAVSVSGRRVAWGNGSGSGDNGMYLLDAGSAQLYRLGTTSGASYVQLCGSAVEWRVAGSGPIFDSVVGEWTR